MEDIDKLKAELVSAVEAAGDLAALEQARVSIFGKKGQITSLLKSLGELSPEERKSAGQSLNEVKDTITDLFKRRENFLRRKDLDERLIRETLDVTLPPEPKKSGRIHPISHTMEELTGIFASMGFVVAEGPDIENDWYNFTALNFPPGHPAREMQDTFFLPDDPAEKGERAKRVLRTHTSPVQIRYMSEHKPPIKIVSMGRTYRSDFDMTHTPMFHQMECLYVDKDVNMGHLKGCLIDFVRAYFEINDLPVRFRPSFFPFVEPGAEVDIGCTRAGGELRIARAASPAEQDWLEILGAGMVHPNVLRNCGIDPDTYQGFAFGLGIERIAMLKYGIPDLRTFYESDVRWLEHYGFTPLKRPNPAISNT